MNRRIFRTLRLPGGCIQGTKGLENHIGATQQTAPLQEEEEDEEEEEEEEEEGGKRKHNEEDPIVRKWQASSDATAPPASNRDLKLANVCLDSIDLQM